MAKAQDSSAAPALELDELPALRPFLAVQPQFAAGSDTPRDFLERCLAALDHWEPRIDAFVNLNIDGARAAADASSRRWREDRPLSPLDGMPPRHQGHHRNDRHADRERLAPLRRVALRSRRRKRCGAA